MGTETKAPVPAPDVEYYLELPYHFHVYRDDSADGPYWAIEVIELKGCAGHGDTVDDAFACVRESMRHWIGVGLENGDVIPEPGADQYSGKFNLRLPKAIHRAAAVRADHEGVSLNTWISTVVTKYGT